MRSHRRHPSEVTSEPSTARPLLPVGSPMKPIRQDFHEDSVNNESSAWAKDQFVLEQVFKSELWP